MELLDVDETECLMVCHLLNGAGDKRARKASAAGVFILILCLELSVTECRCEWCSSTSWQVTTVVYEVL